MNYFFSISILFFSLAITNGKQHIQEQGTDLKIIHVNNPGSPFRTKTSTFSWEHTVLQMQSNDKARLQYFSSLVLLPSTVLPIASGRAITQNPTYIVPVKIGTPAQTLLLALDTSNDAAWIPCSGCIGCSSLTYNPIKSSTFKPLPCSSPQCKQIPNLTCVGKTCGFNTTYGSATLVKDNFTLATDSISDYTFGCIHKTSGPSLPGQGSLGLGRGPLSLLSQTKNLYKSIFSYCLPSYKSVSFTGSLRLGTNRQPLRIKTTQLLKNPRRSSFYYVNLLAIKVGRRVVSIPHSAFAFNPNTGGGTVFDSGTVFTSLVKPAYIAVRDEFRRSVGSAAKVTTLGGFDTCYKVPIKVATITLMFSAGMNMSLGQDNFLIRSSVGNTSCLAMGAASEVGVNSVLNVIGSFQQQNHRILIDVPNSKLGVVREACST